MQDLYLPTNALAALANLAPQVGSAHAEWVQRSDGVFMHSHTHNPLSGPGSYLMHQLLCQAHSHSLHAGAEHTCVLW